MKVSSPAAYDLLMQGTLALAELEHTGMRLDMTYLDKAIETVKKDMEQLEGEIKNTKVYKVWKNAYGSVDLGKSDQLAQVLYKKMGYQCLKYTEKSEKPKMDEEALKQIDGPFVPLYLKRKKLEKILTTYLYGFKREQHNGILHPSFNYNPVSYRSGCSDPNVQNIPSRGPFTKLVRDCFIPRKGRVFVETDYSQLEVRVSACYNKDPVLMAYINDPKTCMHRDTACELFLLTPDQVEKKTTRDWSKNRFVFPEFYGSVFFQCAPNLWKGVLSGAKLPNGKTIRDHLRENGIKDLGECNSRNRPIPGTFEHHVKAVEDSLWHKRFLEYTRWKNRWWRSYCDNGYFEMLTGFVVHGVLKRNDVLNYAIQGSSFHLLLWSLIELQRLIKKYKLKTRIINEIHDCILADVPVNELQDWLYLTRKVMIEKCMKHFSWVCVPLEVEQEVTPEGGTWFDKKEWKEKNGVWSLAA